MAVPHQHEFYRPVLEVIAQSVDGLRHQEIVSLVAAHLSLTADDLQIMTKGRTKSLVDSHIRFVVFVARKAGLLDSSERGKYRITSEGRDFLNRHQDDVPVAELQPLLSRSDEGSEVVNLIFGNPADTSPEDMLDDIHQQLQNQLIDDLLNHLKSIPTTRFEQLVVGLLERMGYGYGLVTRRSHDGGIDGILTQDMLGLMEKVCVQAKRWSNNAVGDPEITGFAGSVGREGATKGVFITTSRFTPALKNAATGNVITTPDNKSIRLIDGSELARLMIAHDLGVVTEITYVVKRLDTNYFAEMG